jgi:hypothetical protein
LSFAITNVWKLTHSRFRLRGFLANALDLNTWFFTVIFLCNSCLTYSIAYFLPIILRDGMGFGVAAAQTLTAPPHLVSLPFMFGFAWAGDKYRRRSPILMCCGTITIIGLSLLAFAKNTGARYFGVFLACIGSNSTIPALLTWQANNVRGQWKRAFSNALMISSGGIGGVIAGFVFRTQDAPAYIPGITTGIVCGAAILLSSVILAIRFWRENKKADRDQKILEGLERFRYTL